MSKVNIIKLMKISNFVFLLKDAQSISADQENATSSLRKIDSNFIEGSTDVSFEDNRTDEFVDLLSMGEDEDNNGSLDDKRVNNNSNQTGNNDNTLIEGVCVEDQVVSDEIVEKEFEEFLNEDDLKYANGSYLCEHKDLLSDNDELKLAKYKRLESIEYTFENYEIFQKIAIEKYGFLNKKFRRKAWPLLILYRKKYLNKTNDNNNNESLKDLIDTSLAKYSEISKF